MKIPRFKNPEKEAEFWDNIDTSEILDTGEQVKVEWDRPGKCPICLTGNLRRRFIDVNLYDGKVTLHEVEVYYCPSCKKTIVPNSSQTEIEKVTKRLQQLKIEEIKSIINTT